ncbi:DUF1761 family protein [Nakamurella sp. YIM 132087]|uniref:DUF1761 family protein n=1 Tax=Nakamurella alba TaxID=2665158 RepID=A0A7K1FES0_9ACTN|nr:DUF1761 family protein [Nakamurella alba]
MFNVLGDINWLAVLVAAVVAVVLAGLWFGLVIAKAYPLALGRDASAPAPTGPVRSIGPLVCTLVVVLTTAVLVEALDISSIGDAVVFGLVVGIGFLTAMTFQIAINPNFPRPLFYGLLNAPYFVISTVVGSVVLVAMR